MRTHGLALLFASAALSGAPDLSHAVSIPLTVNNNVSWVDQGVPIAISTGPAGHPTGTANGLPMAVDRIQGQSFTTTDAFVLDKIWIKYLSVQTGSSAFTMEVRLHQLTDANISDIPLPATNLFSQPQVAHITTPLTNNIVENYLVFDVENVALAANTAYGFFIQSTKVGTTTSSFPFRWFFYNNSPYAGGTHHRLDRDPTASDFDTVFALQYLPQQQQNPQDPPPAIETPEPATASLALIGLAVLLQRRRRA